MTLRLLGWYQQLIPARCFFKRRFVFLDRAELWGYVSRQRYIDIRLLRGKCQGVYFFCSQSTYTYAALT